jgi:mannose/fructose-specific phosphotransferase system component IIA
VAVAARDAKGPVFVVSGVNLPMLLDFLHNRNGAEPKALAERLVARGHASIGVVASPVRAGGSSA